MNVKVPFKAVIKGESSSFFQPTSSRRSVLRTHLYTVDNQSGERYKNMSVSNTLSINSRCNIHHMTLVIRLF